MSGTGEKHVPEWMLKFQEIGQKEEEVLVRDSSGNMTTSTRELRDPNSPTKSRTPYQPPSPHKQPSKAPIIIEDDDEEDAAALFMAAGQKPAILKTEEQQPETQPEKDATIAEEKEHEKPTGTPANVAAELKTEEPAVAATVATTTAVAASSPEEGNNEDTSSKTATTPEGGASLSSSAQQSSAGAVIAPRDGSEATSGGSQQNQGTGSEQAPDDEDDDNNKAVAVAATAATAGTVAAVAATQGEEEEEDFGESWVVDKSQFDDEAQQQGGEAAVGDGGQAQDGDEEIVSESEDGDSDDEEEEEDEMETENAVAARSAISGDDQDQVAQQEPEEGDNLAVAAAVEDDEQRIRQDDDSWLEDSESSPVPEPYDPDYDVENQKRLLQEVPREKRSRMNTWTYFAIFSLIAAGALMIGFFVFGDVLGDDDGEAGIFTPPTAAPTAGFLPLDPTNPGEIDVATTTEFDDIQLGDCDFSQLTLPHVVDQCFCNDEITIIPDDVRARYESLVDFIASFEDGFESDINSCSPTNQALVWMSTGINNGGEISERQRKERFILAYFFLEQGGTSWRDITNWLSEQDVCTWARIVCDDQGNVRGLNFDRIGVLGQLSDAITLLDDLESFSVRQNDIAGTVPESFFASTSLKAIDFGQNAFFGVLPPFGEDTVIEILNLSDNNLSGQLQSNIANADKLRSLDLSNNAFNGALPIELFDLPLLELNLGSNLFSGPIPDEIEDATSLVSLTLGPNQFDGNIPISISRLTNLRTLDIRDVPDLGGRLPASYGLALTNLAEWTISGTSIRGDITGLIGALSNLEVLDLSQNSLSGDLPDTLGLLTKLERLHLDDNRITGTIPPLFGNLFSLAELKLDTNRLTGTIPPLLGALTSLRTLTLEGNLLAGRSPEEVCELRTGSLLEYTVDCPSQDSFGDLTGIICTSSCCTQCF